MTGDMQFDKAEPTSGQETLACVSCKQPIGDTYYEVNGKMVCPRCQASLAARGGESGNFLNAVMLGVLATTSRRDRPGGGHLALGIVVIIAILYATPLLAGLKSPILLVILGIALYEAWKLNRRLTLTFTGPYRVGTAPASG